MESKVFPGCFWGNRGSTVDGGRNFGSTPRRSRALLSLALLAEPMERSSASGLVRAVGS